ncbi:MAG: hypothetical protein HEP80_00460 [Dolichospermum sp. UKL201]|jgi:hypothetical protein|nr:MAG: hypothetical protein HEP80_00460 [Dolichospermum sp. UKL201]
MQLAIASPLEALNHPLSVHQFLQTAAELPYSQLTTSNHWRKLSINSSKPIVAAFGVAKQYFINHEKYKFRLYYDLRNGTLVGCVRPHKSCK